MRRSLLPYLLGGVAFATVFAAVGLKEANAARYYRAAPASPAPDDNGLHLGVDGGLVLPFSNTAVGDCCGPSVGANGFLGFRAGGRAAWIQPEVELGIAHFRAGNFGDYPVGRFMGGLRVGNRGFVQAQGLAHIGYGAGGGGFNGFAWDVGGALDFHVRHWNIGAIATFNALHDDHPSGGFLKWIYIGPQVGLTF